MQQSLFATARFALLTCALTVCAGAPAQSASDRIRLAADAPQPDLARQVFDEINLVRTNPAGWASRLASLRPAYSGLRLVIAGTGYRTREGVAALDEAVRFLSNARPLPPLVWSPALTRAAGIHVADQSRTGLVGHAGSDGSRPSGRLARCGQAQSRTGESIAYGFCGPETGETVVAQLLVDDGVPDRIHRRQLFMPEFRLAGIATGTHPRLTRICVIEFAAAFTANGTYLE